MDYAWPILLTLLNAGWLLSILLGLPGTWLMIGSAIALQWARQVPYFSLATLVVVALLALAGEIFEFMTGMLGAKRAGGTGRGALGALLGGFAGAILGTVLIPVPLIGTLVGACVGAAGGTILLEVGGGMPTDASIRVGVGAGVGRLVGTVLKMILGVVIWIILAIAVFWP